MYYIAIFLVRIAYFIWYNIKFEGKENIPKDRGCVYVSNHRTYADPPLIVLGVKRKFSFMAKEELFKFKPFAVLIKSLGAFPVARGKGDEKAIESAVETIKNGRNLVIFPEGTRSKDGKLGKGKSGAALVATKAHTDIVPVGIIFEGNKLKFRSKITVRYGKPISYKEYIDENGEPVLRKLVKFKNKYMENIGVLIGQGDNENKKSKEDSDV